MNDTLHLKILLYSYIYVYPKIYLVENLSILINIYQLYFSGKNEFRLEFIYEEFMNKSHTLFSNHKDKSLDLNSKSYCVNYKFQLLQYYK